MSFQEMKIQGAWVHTPSRHEDLRGHVEEQFKLSALAHELSMNFNVKQVNQSVSNLGVLRGIHYTKSSEGPAKYISCPNGRIWDVVVDLRLESPTYGTWDALELSAENGKSVLISEGLGHAFLSLEPGSVSTYLLTEEFNSSSDQGVHPLSPGLAIPFQDVAAGNGITELIMSDRDQNSPEF